MRGWNSGVGELPLIGTVVGAALGAFVVAIDSRSQNKKMQAGFKPEPEDRLRLAMYGGVGFAASMFWLAWVRHSQLSFLFQWQLSSRSLATADKKNQ